MELIRLMNGVRKI